MADEKPLMISIITGASSGIARALCLALAERPSPITHTRRIVAVARRQKELLELAQEVQGPPGGAVLTPVVADISTPEGVDSVCSTVYQILLGLGQASHVAHVVHCAGVLESVGSKVLDVRAPTLRKTLAVNVEAPLLLTGELYARDLIQPYESTNSVRMIPEGFGGSSECVKPGRTRIMVMGSGAAHKPVAGWPTYGPSKAALYAAVRQMIAEGVLAASVRPGIVDTPMLRRARSAAGQDRHKPISAEPSMQPQHPEDVAQFLCGVLLDTSDEDFLNGVKEWDYKSDLWRVMDITSKAAEQIMGSPSSKQILLDSPATSNLPIKPDPMTQVLSSQFNRDTVEATSSGNNEPDKEDEPLKLCPVQPDPVAAAAKAKFAAWLMEN